MTSSFAPGSSVYEVRSSVIGPESAKTRKESDKDFLKCLPPKVVNKMMKAALASMA